MTGLDTNILLRFLLNDDPKQSERAARAIQACTAERPGYINLVTIAEVAWVLARAYRFTSLEIADAIEALLQADTLLLQSQKEVFLAVAAIRSGASSFSDALISALNQRAGCKLTLTFDVNAARLPGFTLL